MNAYYACYPLVQMSGKPTILHATHATIWFNDECSQERLGEVIDILDKLLLGESEVKIIGYSDLNDRRVALLEFKENHQEKIRLLNELNKAHTYRRELGKDQYDKYIFHTSVKDSELLENSLRLAKYGLVKNFETKEIIHLF